MADVHLNRGGTSLGIFPEAEVREGLRSGRFLPSDLAWRQGMATWLPVGQIPDLNESAATATTAGGAPPLVTPPIATAPTTPTPPLLARRTEPLAVWSLVLSCVSLVCCGLLFGIPGVICGHLALSKFRLHPELEGRGMATAGLVVGYLSIAFWIIYGLFFGGLSALHSLSQRGG